MAFAYKKICMVGPGSIGGTVAAKIARSGNFEVTALARPERAARINAKGITLQTLDGTFTVPMRASDKAADLGKQDLVMIAVKYHNLHEVLDQLTALCRSDTPMVFLLNGVPWWFFDNFPGPLNGTKLESVDPGGLLRRSIPMTDMIWSAVIIGAADQPDGVIDVKFTGDVILGRADNTTKKLDDIAAVFQAGNITTKITTKIRDEVWSKLLANTSTNPVSSLALATVADIMADPLLENLVFSIIDEVKRVGEALGLEVNARVTETMRGAGSKVRSRSSMLQDIDRGRPPELDALVGAVIEIADKLNIPVPLTSAVYALLRSRTKAVHAGTVS